MARGDDDVTWWENDGSESFTEHLIEGDFDHAYSVYATDIDLDGDVDVLGSARRADTVTWWENDGSESFTENPIQTNFDGAETVYAADIDGDGDIDILAASNEDDDIAWWENTATFSFEPSWTTYSINSTAVGAESVFVADIDGDGDLDVVAALSGEEGGVTEVAWYENDGTPSNGWTYHTVKSYTGTGINDVFVADMDGDGDLDILSVDGSGNDDKVLYHINDGTPGNGVWSTKTVVSGSDADGAVSVHAADIDDDGDLDIVAAFSMESNIAWFENDGTPDNDDWTQHDVYASDSDKQPYDIDVGDIDGDGDLDIVEADQENKVRWYENDGTPGSGDWSSTRIKGGLSGVISVAIADMDNDGDLDVVSAAYSGNAVSWHLNDGSPGDAIWTTYTVATPTKPTSVFPIDIDHDGDIDIVSCAETGTSSNGKVRWYVNDGTPDDGWTTNNIASSIKKPSSVFVADIDNDGNLDVVSAAYNDEDRKSVV